MTMKYRIVCDACQSDRLYGTPHLALGLRPAFTGSTRDLHFCDPDCLREYVSRGLPVAFDEHSKLYRSTRAPR